MYLLLVSRNVSLIVIPELFVELLISQKFPIIFINNIEIRQTKGCSLIRANTYVEISHCI